MASNLAPGKKTRAASVRTGDTRPLVPTPDLEREVYETPDVDDLDTHDTDDVSSRQNVMPNDIDATPLDPSGALQTFSNKTLDLRRADYSDAIRPPKLATELVGILPAKERAFETPVETYQRLKKEVSQLIDDLNVVAKEFDGKKKSMAPFPPELLSELKALEQTLVSVAADKRLNGLFSPADGSGSVATNAILENLKALQTSQPKPAGASSGNGVTYEVFLDKMPGTVPLDSIPNEHVLLSHINQRVSALEALVGSTNAQFAGKDLKSMAQDLSQRVRLLDLAHLEVVHVRIKSLSQSIETVQQQRRNLPKAVVHKVDTLYDMVNKLDGLIDEVPMIIARLQSLQRVHESGASFMSDFNKLQSQQAALKTLLEKQSQSLTQVESTMASNFKTIADNFQLLQARMAKLEAKLG